MNRLFKSLSVTAIAGLLSAVAWSEEGTCCIPITLEVRAAFSAPDKPILKVRLVNKSKQELVFPIGNGPWIGPGEIKTYAIELPRGMAIVNQYSALLDPAPGKVVLEPGKFKEEDVVLDLSYPALAEAIRSGERDLMVFWTYQLRLTDGRRSERLGGWVMFPKKVENDKK